MSYKNSASATSDRPSANVSGNPIPLGSTKSKKTQSGKQLRVDDDVYDRWHSHRRELEVTLRLLALKGVGPDEIKTLCTQLNSASILLDCVGDGVIPTEYLTKIQSLITKLLPVVKIKQYERKPYVRKSHNQTQAV